MRRTAAAAMAAALVLTGCNGDPDSPDQDAATGPPVTTAPETDDDADDDDTVDDTDAAEPGDTGPDETEVAADDGSTDDAADDDVTDDAPDLFDDPAWVDPEDQVEVAPARGAFEARQEITGIRMAPHDRFDRVVLDLTGDEVVLGWFGLYEDAPYEAGSGKPIDFAGNAVLSVPVEGIDWTNPHPDRTDGSDLQGGGGLNVVEVVFGVLFEGQQQVFVSVVDRTPYRIFPLNDPARIVIDVQHP